MTNNAAFNALRSRGDRRPSEGLTRDRELLAGFWATYPDDVAEESLLAAQLVQAVLQAEHRHDQRNGDGSDARDVEVTHEFIRAVVDRMAA
jgi:hypothetical protein